MSVDKFGHYINDKQNTNHLKRYERTSLGLYIDTDGNFNIQRKRIKNGSTPKEKSDIVIKEYVDKGLSNFKDSLSVCDNLDACIKVDVTVDVRHTVIYETETAIINHLARARHWLEYADWQKSFILLYQLSNRINSKERLIVFIDTLGVYQPQTTVQLSHLVRLIKQIVLSLEPLDDMEVNVLSRMLHIIASTFKFIIGSNELNILMEEYYRTMVDDLCDLLNKFSAEWEFIPKSQCKAESESCLNIDNFRHRLEQMSILQPDGLEHINNWLHAHWKLSTCLFYMGMGTARRLHPDEGPKIIERSTFTMRMESFDLDLEQAIVIESADSMHTLIFTEKLLQELRHHLRSDEVLISIRSHKQSQYWWYPEHESRTQVLVVNAYTANTLLEKTKLLSEPFQYVSKLKMNFSANDFKTSKTKIVRDMFWRGVDFDDPEEDVENVIHDNVLSPNEVRIYRTELYGHSVLGVTFTKVDINYRVLLRMTNIPKLKDIDTENAPCLVKARAVEPIALLLRNRCAKARPVYIYLRADNPSENWDSFYELGAFFTFTTEVRSCRIWNYARPEPSWQTISCIPEMNKSVYFGIHCRCNFISDLDADAKPIIAVRMNLKCHLDRPIVSKNYKIILCILLIPTTSIVYLCIKMERVSHWSKSLYLEEISSGKLCHHGDVLVELTFGGRYNSGSSSNIIISLQSSRGLINVVIYQDSLYPNFQRNNTISFRINRMLLQLPARLSLGHDNSGINPHFFCRNVVFTDIISKQTQYFSFQCWIRDHAKHLSWKSGKLFYNFTNFKKDNTWRARYSNTIESCMGNWYLFQPLRGPWRFGICRESLSRWERTCIYITKIFISMCVVIIYFGKAEPITCDPSPKRNSDINFVVWLCVCCLFATYFGEVIMIVFHGIISNYE